MIQTVGEVRAELKKQKHGPGMERTGNENKAPSVLKRSENR